MLNLSSKVSNYCTMCSLRPKAMFVCKSRWRNASSGQSLVSIVEIELLKIELKWMWKKVNFLCILVSIVQRNFEHFNFPCKKEAFIFFQNYIKIWHLNIIDILSHGLVMIFNSRGPPPMCASMGAWSVIPPSIWAEILRACVCNSTKKHISQIPEE